MGAFTGFMETLLDAIGEKLRDRVFRTRLIAIVLGAAMVIGGRIYQSEWQLHHPAPFFEAKRGGYAYADVAALTPVARFDTMAFQSVNRTRFICQCITVDGSTVWAVIYAEDLSMRMQELGKIPRMDVTLEFDQPLRICGTAKSTESYGNGLDKFTGELRALDVAWGCFRDYTQ